MHETEHSAPQSQQPGPAILARVVAITLLGLFLRLYGLTSYGLWFDEAYHVALVRLPTVWAMLDAVLSNPPSDPLYVLVLRPWVDLFGADVSSIRALSVLFATATIPTTFFLGRHALGVAAGLWGALFFAISPFAIELGQEAALYTLAAFLTTLVLAVGWRWLRTGKGLGIYMVAGVLAIYSHYVVAVILLLFAALLLPLFPRFGRERGRWVFANGFVVLAWSPWLVALILHWLTADLPRATLRHPATFQEVLGALIQFTSGTSALQQGQRWLWGAGLTSGLILLLAGWLAASRTGRRGVNVMLVLFLVVCIPPAVVSAITGRWLFVPHFMLFLLPALFTCLACAPYAMRPPRQAALGAAVVGALILWLGVQGSGIVLYNSYPPHGADGLRELAARITTEIRPYEPVFVTPPALGPTLKQYFSGELTGIPEDFDLRRVYIPYDPVDWHDRSLSRIVARMETVPPQRFWLVYRSELDDGGQLLADLRSRYRLSDVQHYEFADLYLFTVKP